MRKSTVRLYLWILNRKLDPAEITNLLKLEPTFSFRKGEGIRRPAVTGGWSRSYEMHSAANDADEKLIEKLVCCFDQDFRRKKTILKKISLKYECWLKLCIYHDDIHKFAEVNVCFSPETQKLLAKYALPFYTDVYLMTIQDLEKGLEKSILKTV